MMPMDILNDVAESSFPNVPILVNITGERPSNVHPTMTWPLEVG